MGQSAFLNAAVLVETSLTPDELLDEAGRIERDLGRQREERWGPRPIDLDLLLFGELVVATNRLQLPHPRMAWRRFVLLPAVEVAPAMRHPRIGWTVEQLLNHLDTATAYLAVAGPAGAGKAELARAAVTRLGGGLITDPVSLDCRRTGLGKSYGFELDTEIEFAKRRAAAVDVNSPVWSERCPLWISDFWVGQSALTILALSEESRRGVLLEHWRDVTRQACTPKLTILLDTPAQWCAKRLVSRGLPEPDAPELRDINAGRETAFEQTSQPGFGPVLVVDGQRPTDALEELTAAALAMDSGTHNEY